MRNICIVHFQPIEKYPPAFNLLRTLANQQNKSVSVHIITTDPGNAKQTISIPGIQIHRVARWNTGMSRLRRMWLYVYFNARAFFILLQKRPSAILYYETLSAGAPCLYKSLALSNLLIHYHEYSSPGEYKNGMVLNRWLHKLEQKQYKKASWVSHTNEDRMKMFLADCGAVAPIHHFIVPNYPPADWTQKAANEKQSPSEKTGFVYVGALDTDTMYLKEMAVFIAANAASCYWDIYSDNHSAAATVYLENLHAPNIRFRGAVAYDELPAILVQYQVGLILYNGHIPNYTFNAPNKLFEYAVSGLDVWFPEHMISSKPYITSNTYPKILSLNFLSLHTIDMAALRNRDRCAYRPHNYNCETVYGPLLASLCE